MIAAEMASAFGKSVSLSTIKRLLNKYGMRGCKDAKKPFVSAKNRKARYLWAKDRLHWTFKE